MKSKSTPIIIAVLIPLVSIAAAVSLIYLKKSGSNSGVEFPYEAYMRAPENMTGNSYTMRAEFELQLANFGEKGRLVAVRDSASGKKIAVLLPTKISENIMTRQRYELDLKVSDKGRIIVNSMRKY